MAEAKSENKKPKKQMQNNPVGLFYCLGLFGAAIYYVQQADGLGEIIVALLKSLVWPAFFVYDILKYIGA